ncbi:MAG: sigma-70 family RNA polymerase sigma factor [Elusimicrobia bacterium]|nr:sigma-70 family RNA polymerase sigma factor [Elusimicrobiota bacterium]
MTPEQSRRLSGLMAGAQAADSQAYADALIEMAERLRGFFRGRVLPWESVEDLVQETLLSIHKARHTYDPARPFAPWFYAIARYRLADARRANLRQSRQTEWQAPPAAGASDPEKMSPDMEEALARLPERRREIVRMLKVEGFSVKETAAKLGMSESAVKVAAHRGYRALKEYLEARHENG